MDNPVCPLCGSTTCHLTITTNHFVFVQCKLLNFECYIDEDIVGWDYSDIEYESREKALDLVVEHLMHNPVLKKKNNSELKWGFYYDPDGEETEYDQHAQMVNIADCIKSYPNTVVDLADRALMNLSLRAPNYGDMITIIPAIKRVVFSQNGQIYPIFEILADLDYLKKDERDGFYKISANGWKRIAALREKEKEIRQGFIAMRFSDETKSIREAFRSGIAEAGYAVRIIDEKEHNNQIVPEIFFEIRRSAFIVVDVTFPNYGAYYEAGYAQALGKEVIICCRDREFHSKDNRPHFDISQKSMIIWKDEAELVARLKRRIEATVSVNIVN